MLCLFHVSDNPHFGLTCAGEDSSVGTRMVTRFGSKKRPSVVSPESAKAKVQVVKGKSSVSKVKSAASFRRIVGSTKGSPKSSSSTSSSSSSKSVGKDSKVVVGGSSVGSSSSKMVAKAMKGAKSVKGTKVAKGAGVSKTSKGGSISKSSAVVQPGKDGKSGEGGNSKAAKVTKGDVAGSSKGSGKVSSNSKGSPKPFSVSVSSGKGVKATAKAPKVARVSKAPKPAKGAKDEVAESSKKGSSKSSCISKLATKLRKGAKHVLTGSTKKIAKQARSKAKSAMSAAGLKDPPPVRRISKVAGFHLPGESNETTDGNAALIAMMSKLLAAENGGHSSMDDRKPAAVGSQSESLKSTLKKLLAQMDDGKPEAKKDPLPAASKGNNDLNGISLDFHRVKNDPRTQWVMELLACGLLVAFLKKAMKDEGACDAGFFRMLKQDEEERKKLGIITIVSRKGAKQTKLMQAPKSTWQWEMVVFPMSAKASQKDRIQKVQRMIDSCNSPTHQAKMTCPRTSVLHCDATVKPLRSADQVMLDKDIIDLIHHMHQPLKMEQIAKLPDKEIGKFFKNTKRGRKVLKDHCATQLLALNMAAEADSEEEEDHFDEPTDEALCDMIAATEELTPEEEADGVIDLEEESEEEDDDDELSGDGSMGSFIADEEENDTDEGSWNAEGENEEDDKEGQSESDEEIEDDGTHGLEDGDGEESEADDSGNEEVAVETVEEEEEDQETFGVFM